MGGRALPHLLSVCAPRLGQPPFEILPASARLEPARLGASGANSGIAAAYVVLYPGSHVQDVLIPLGTSSFSPRRIPGVGLIGCAFRDASLIYGAPAISQVNAGGVAYSAHPSGLPLRTPVRPPVRADEQGPTVFASTTRLRGL